MINATIRLYKDSYAGLSRRIWLLALVMLINRSGTMVLAFMTLYCRNLGFSIRQGGLVVAVYGIGSMVGALLGGKATDHWGFYRVQFAALFFGGTLFMLLGQMKSYEAICICTFFLSMVNESFRPANASAITHYSDATSRTQSFSLVRLSINLGWAIGSALGGILASIHYQLLFWVDGITNISAALMLLFLLPVVTLSQQKKDHGTGLQIRKNQSPFADKIFLKFLLLQVTFALCFFQLFTTIPIFFKSTLLLNEFSIGVTMAFNGLLIALVEMVIVYKLEGKRPYLQLMGWGTLLMGVSFLMLLLPLLNGFWIAMTFMLVITVAEMIAMPFMNSYYISRTNHNNRGQYAGLYTMAWSIAQVIGSFSGAMMADKLGFNLLWTIIFLICLITAIGYFQLEKKKL
jgi:predicted MFS family arabinose efflux permease